MIYAVIIFISVVLITFVGLFVLFKPFSSTKITLLEQQNEQQLSYDYIKPQFKPLTSEQIQDIHSRGKITPAKKVKEWEFMDLCAPGGTIVSASSRCRRFRHCCHDCLVDYANEHDEHISILNMDKEVHYQISN